MFALHVDGLGDRIVRIRTMRDFLRAYRPPCALLNIPDGDLNEAMTLLEFDGTKGASAALEEAVGVLRRNRASIYMTGDCWHFALAMTRIYPASGIEIVAYRKAGQRSIDHVAARFPSGIVVDSCGVFFNEREHGASVRHLLSMRNGGVRMPAWQPPVRVEKAGVLAILDNFAREAGCPPYPWDDPEAYHFAGETEDFIRLCYAPAIERALASRKIDDLVRMTTDMRRTASPRP